MSPTPSIDTRVLKMTPRSLARRRHLLEHRDGALRRHAGGVDPELAQARKPVEHHLADLDQVVAGRRLAAGHVGDLDVLPEVGDSNTRSICSSVMSSLRSPRFQLLHISQRASHTHVQLKMSTVGWIGLIVAM